MKNLYRAEAATVPLIMSANVVSGQLVAVGNFVGCVACDGKIGDSVEVALEGEYIVPKLAADAIAQGAVVKFDPTTGIAQNAGTRTAGVATQAAGAGSTQVYVRLVQQALATPALAEATAPQGHQHEHAKPEHAGKH